jgi:hypothetical protein
MRPPAKRSIASRLETILGRNMAQRIMVVHRDAVVRADLTDALKAARPSVLTQAFADVESLAMHLQGADSADLLLFDAQCKLPEPLLSMFRCAVPMAFNPMDTDTFADPSGVPRVPLPIPVRDDCLAALLDGVFGTDRWS